MKKKPVTRVKAKRKTIRGVSKQALTKWQTGNWKEIFISTGTRSGVEVSNESALQISTVFSYIRNISEDVAKVPVKVYRKTGDDKERVNDHPIQKLLNYQPNNEMTAMDFRQTLTAHCLGWGNGYAEIQRDVLGNIVALWPLHPKNVKPKRHDIGDIVYEVQQDDGSFIDFSQQTILHVRGLGDDGIVGHNVIRFARENLGMARAAEMFGATYFGNNTVMGGILSHPANLSKDAQGRLADGIKNKHQGPDKAHNLLILEEGMKYEKTVIPPEESQFLETRQFSVPEICRWFRMPPHKAADLNRATFSNIEHQDLEYVKDCLTAWFKRWEQALWWKLLSETEKQAGYFIEHTVEGLLRGDIASRYQAYQISLGNNNNPGFMTINEVRALENLNAVDGGDKLFSPQSAAENYKKEEPMEQNQDEQLQPDS